MAFGPSTSVSGAYIIFASLRERVRGRNPTLKKDRAQTIHLFDCTIWGQGACPPPGATEVGPGASALGSRAGIGIASEIGARVDPCAGPPIKPLDCPGD